MKKIVLLLLTVLSLQSLSAQEVATKSDTLRKDALNVFMDATDYIRKEIPYVNYVRDIKDAGVYILSTSQRTGSGGIEFSYFLVGQNNNAGMRDTVSFVTSPDDTEDERRIKEVRTLKMGLMRYVAKTPLAQYMKISFTEPLSETVSTDKWDSWVFRSSFNGFLDGQQLYKQKNVFGNVSANRVTKDWKINTSGSLSYRVTEIETPDSLYIIDNNSKSVRALVVKSISDHWSVGGSFYAGSATYSNYKLDTYIMPGIEYDLFPYSESTKRQLRILYSAGLSYSNYVDTSIYFKKRELHPQQSLMAAYEVVQKWGSINVSLEYKNYLHDFSKNNLSLDGFIELRIAKGLNLNFGGGASIIHDQLNLPKGEATTAELLTQRKEVATQFQYFTMFGFTYTFGSIYNNVVNPRFGNGGGGGMSFSFN